jgi:ribosomal protein S18 acetylase RimI-like enzyme
VDDKPQQAVAEYLRAVMHSRRDVVRVGPFVAGFDAMSQNPAVNYAVPDADAHPSADDVADLVRAFRERGLRPRLEYLPATAPRVREALLAAGFVEEGTYPVMLANPQTFADVPPPPGFQIRAPLVDSEFWQVRRAQNEAFGDGEPGPLEILRLHALIRQGGLSRMAVSRAGEVAGGGDLTPAHGGIAEVAGIGVREPFRRRGVGQALTAALVRAGFEQGLDRVWLTPAGPAEQRMYERVGFVAGGHALHLSLPAAR